MAADNLIVIKNNVRGIQSSQKRSKPKRLRPVWLNGWIFVYKLNGCGFEPRCCHLNFRYRACFEQGVP